MTGRLNDGHSSSVHPNLPSSLGLHLVLPCHINPQDWMVSGFPYCLEALSKSSPLPSVMAPLSCPSLETQHTINAEALFMMRRL